MQCARCGEQIQQFYVRYGAEGPKTICTRCYDAEQEHPSSEPTTNVFGFTEEDKHIAHDLGVSLA